MTTSSFSAVFKNCESLSLTSLTLAIFMYPLHSVRSYDYSHVTELVKGIPGAWLGGTDCAISPTLHHGAARGSGKGAMRVAAIRFPRARLGPTQSGFFVRAWCSE